MNGSFSHRSRMCKAGVSRSRRTPLTLKDSIRILNTGSTLSLNLEMNVKSVDASASLPRTPEPIASETEEC